MRAGLHTLRMRCPKTASRGVIYVTFPVPVLASSARFVNRRTEACTDYDKLASR